MSQSSVIFFFLFAAFIVFITQKGELPTYLGLLFLSPQTTGGTTQTSATSLSTVAQSAEAIGQAAAALGG